MTIRYRILILVLLTFVSTLAIGGFAIRQLRQNESTIHVLTEELVPSALATADLIAHIKDVQLTAVSLASSADANVSEQAAGKTRGLQAQIARMLDAQEAAAISDQQRGLLKQIRESLANYSKSIEEMSTFAVGGQKEIAEAMLYSNVAEYQNELASIVETLRIEKNRSKDDAIVELNARLTQSERTVIGATLSTLLLAALVGGWLFLQINRPLRRIQGEIATVRANLDLTHRIPATGAIEIDRVADSVNALLAEFQAIVRGVQDAGSHVSLKSDELAQTAELLLSAVHHQNDATASMASSVQQMAVSVAHVAESSDAAHKIAHASLAEATDGGKAIERSVSEMVKMVDNVRTTSAAMADLGKRSTEVGSITVTIKEIAEQTSLLALNAAIEAARAGEQGRGFAVVADEVRKLAERTTNATQDIATVIRAIQSETHALVDNMRHIAGQVEENTVGARSVGESIVEICGCSTRVVDVANDMSVSLRDQANATEQMAQQIEQISAMSERNYSEMGEAKQVSTILKQLAGEMQQLVVRFQV